MQQQECIATYGVTRLEPEDEYMDFPGLGLQDIKAWWEKRVSSVATVSHKGTSIAPGEVYYQRMLDISTDKRTHLLETIVLTEKEYFIRTLQSKEE